MGLTCPEPEQNPSRTSAPADEILTAHTGSRLQAPSRCSGAGSCRRGRPGSAAARPPLCRWVRGRRTSSPSPSRLRRPWQLCYPAASLPLSFLLLLLLPLSRATCTTCCKLQRKSLQVPVVPSTGVRQSENSEVLLIVVSFASSPTLTCSASLTSNLYGVAAAQIRLLSRLHMHVQGVNAGCHVCVCVGLRNCRK